MNILKFILLILLSKLFLNNYFAQITINGTITDADSNPIVSAIVEIIDQDDTTNYYTTNTNESGYFVISNITDIESRITNLPSDFIVLSNYPNPFNPSTIIYYELPKSENIEIKIYDILGREVRTLFDNFHRAGTYTLHWDGRNNWNSPVAAGVYLCRLKTKDHFKVHKMLLLDGGKGKVKSSVFKNNISSIHQKIHTISSLLNLKLRIEEKYINPIEIRFSCKGDTTLDFTVSRPLVMTIGPEGGEFLNNEFYMNIPPSAFSDNVELRLYTISEDDSPIDEEVTKIYKLEGIPPYNNNNFKIGVKYDGELSNESVIAFGTKFFNPNINSKFIYYRPVIATDSAGFLWTYYPPHILGQETKTEYFENLSKKNNDEIYNRYIKGKTNEKIVESENFSALLQEIAWNVPILNYLENAWDKYKSMGFSFTPDNIPYVNRPVNVHAMYFTNTGMNEYEGVVFGNGFSYISTSLSNLPSQIRNTSIGFFWWIFVDDYPYKNKYQAISGIVLFDAISQIYDKTEGKYNLKHPNRNWFYKATAHWAGELFSTEDNYIPFGFKGNELAPFNGIVAGAGQDEDYVKSHRHGYGMTTLIKYAMDRAKNDGTFQSFLSSLYLRILNGEHPIYAFSQTIAIPTAVWLNNYFAEYLSGKIYNVPASVFLNADQEYLINIDISDNTNSKVTFTRNYPDLSAKLFKLNFKYDETKLNNELILEAKHKTDTETNFSTLLFGLKDNKLEYIKTGFEKVISNIKDLQEGGYKTLLAAVINPSLFEYDFNLKTSIDFDIKIKEALEFKYCDIRLSVIALQDTNEIQWSPGWYTVGAFSDNVFYGQINTEKQGGNATGTIRVELEDNLNIRSLSVMANHSDQYSSSQWGFTASGVPHTENDTYVLVYSHSGTKVCSYVNSITGKYWMPDGSADDLKLLKCETESLLHIKFHNYD